jgi:hypothetical protein
MTLRIKLAISMCALCLGLVAAQFPSHVARADISICTSCGAAAVGDDGGAAGGGVGLPSTFGTP